MPEADPQGWDSGFLESTAWRFLEAQRAQREAIDQQIAALEAQRQALDALIEPLEQRLGSAASRADERPHDAVNEPPSSYVERSPERPLGVIDAAVEVLRRADGPLHFSVIAQRALNCGLWQSNAIKPEDSMKGALNSHIRNAGESSKFCRVGPGVFALIAANDSGE